MLQTLLHLIYPPKCPFCQKLSPSAEPALCPQCRKTLPWIEGVFRGTGFSRGVYTLQYKDTVRESLLRYKFSGRSAYERVYGELLAESVAERLAGAFDLVSYVPVSRRTLRSRGYDQAKLLAQSVARIYGVKVVTTLRKIRSNRKQSGLSDAKARRENVRGVYEAVDPAQFAGKRVLLIDDIVTTGATLSSAAQTLQAAGAADVVCAALAGGAQSNK